MTSGTFLVAVGMALFLGACGSLPKPFEPVQRNAIPLPESPSILGIGVLALQTPDPALGQALADDIAAQLTERDIPAQAVNRLGQLGYSLEGRIGTTASASASTQILIEWNLTDRAGALVETFTLPLPVVAGENMTLREDQRRQIASDIAERITNSMGPALPEAPPTALIGEGLTVTIIPPQQAPGDGAASLARTLANRLAQQGFSPAAGEFDFQIVGAVEVRPYDSAQDDVAIAWRVLNAQEEDLGEVRLDNRIPRGELDGAWGLIAEAIIDSAFPGLMEIIASAVEQTRNQ